MKLEEHVIAAGKLVGRIEDRSTANIVSYGEAITALKKNQELLSERLEELSEKLQNQENISEDSQKRIEKNDAAMLLLSSCDEVLDEKMNSNSPNLEEIRRDILWIHYIHQRVLASIKRQEARAMFMCHVNDFMQAEQSFFENIQTSSQAAMVLLKSYRGGLEQIFDREKINTITQFVLLSRVLINHFEMSIEDREKYEKLPQSIVLFMMDRFFSDQFKLQLRNLIILLHAEEELMCFFKEIQNAPTKSVPFEMKKLCEAILAENGFAFHQHPVRYENLLNNLKENIQNYSQYDHPVYQPARNGVPISSNELVYMLTQTISYIKDSTIIHARESELLFFKKIIDDKIASLKTEPLTSRLGNFFRRNEASKKELTELYNLKNRLQVYREGMIANLCDDSAEKEIETEEALWEYGAITVLKEMIYFLEEMGPISENGWAFCLVLFNHIKEMIEDKPNDIVCAKNYRVFQRFLQLHLNAFRKMGIEKIADVFTQRPVQGQSQDMALSQSQKSCFLSKPEILATKELMSAVEAVHSDGPSTIMSADDFWVDQSLRDSFMDSADEVEFGDVSLMPQDPEKAYALGDKCEQAMDYERAEDYYFLAAESGHRLAQYQLVRMYERGLSRNPEAHKQILDLYLRVARRDWLAPVEVYYALGKIYAHKKQYFKAKEYYEHAANRDYPPAHYALGRLYEEGIFKLKEGQRVEKWYKMVIATAKKMLRNSKMQVKLEGASEYIFDSLEMARITADAHYRIGRIYETKGRQEDVACISYHHAIELLSGGYAPAQVRLGILAEGRGEYVEALSWYEAAVSTDHYVFHSFSALNPLGYSMIVPPEKDKHNLYFDPQEGIWMILYTTGEVFRGKLPETVNVKLDTIEQLNAPQFKTSVLMALARAEYIQWGDAEAYERMGILYSSLRPGIPHDQVKARSFFATALRIRGEDVMDFEASSIAPSAEKESLGAKLQLEIADLQEADCHLAIDWLFAAAKRGEKSAIHFLCQLAEMGNVEAQFVLGECKIKGLAMDIDIDQAIFYYHLTAKQGHRAAKIALRTLGYQGHVKAQRCLGWLYELGEGVKRDLEQATFWLQLVADNGDNQIKVDLKRLADVGCADAQARYGALCLRQAMTLADEKIAYAYLKQAIDSNSTEASLYLGWIYDYGLAGIKPSLQAATFFYLKATVHFPLTSIFLGLSYLRQLKATSYTPARKAGELFIQGIEMANRRSYHNYRGFVIFFERMASKGHLSAQLFLAFVYDKGLLGIKADAEKARMYYDTILNQGDAYTHYNLGILFEKGHWLQQSCAEARKWYESAAQKGHLGAMEALNKLYLYGTDKFESDFERARYWRDQIKKQASEEIKPTVLQSEPAPRASVKRFFSDVSKSLHGISRRGEIVEDVTMRYMQRAKVLYNFVADRDDRLSINQDEVLYVLSKNDEWWHCETQTYPFRDGKVPATFLEALPIASLMDMHAAAEENVSIAMDLPATALAIAETDLQMIRRLGEGTFGEVYQAWWPELNLLVAVKKSRSMACADESVREEFEHELRVMIHLRHPNIVTLCGYTSDTAIAHLVMEFMPGGELWDYLGGNNGKRESLSWTTRVSIALNIANGLAYLHQERMLHRDLKSKNVLLCTYGNNPYFAKLADFGLVHKHDEVGSLKTLYDKTTGTPAWMAPELLIDAKEQQNGRAYRPASDVYSLAMVFWELVSEKEPYLMLERKFIQLAIAEYVCDKGLRETIPDETPIWMRNLIEGAWAQDPRARLPLSVIIAELRAVLNELGVVGSQAEMDEMAVGGASLAESADRRVVPRVNIPEFELMFAGDGELSLYQAVATQLRLTDRRFLCGLPEGGALCHRLQRLVYERSQLGNNYNDLSMIEAIQQLAECTNSIIAIIDTRYPERGFYGYCINELGLRESSYDARRMPNGVPIIRLAFTGEYYFSVKSHPDLDSGAIREACQLGEKRQGIISNSRLSVSPLAFVNQLSASGPSSIADMSASSSTSHFFLK